MLPLLFLIATAGLIEARPSAIMRPSFGFMGIVGGVDAAQGEFPWQLSQQRLGGSWSHSCGASLIGNTRGLSAAHCVDGASPSSLRVIAGLYRRSDESGTQIANIASYTMHENYNQGNPTFANDVAILNFASSISAGGNVGFATLASSGNQYDGTTCVMSGWGRTSASNVLPDTLQKASIQAIGTAQCNSLISGIGTAWEGHICLYDASGRIGSCNGDSGGPLNCPDGGATVVAGVTSWGISSLGVCRQDYPSVYTRVSFYLAWINSHM